MRGGDADADTDTDTDTETDTDSETGANCTEATPCGGDADLVGAWAVTSSDLEVSGEIDLSSFGFSDDCVALVSGTLSVTGTWTGDADGRYTDNTVTTGVETLELSEYCVPWFATCSRAAGPIWSLGYAEVDCTDNSETGLCTCSTVIDQACGIGLAPGEPSAEGPYFAAGNTLTIIEGEQEYMFNVDGTVLTMTPVSTGFTGTITGTVELQRQ